MRLLVLGGTPFPGRHVVEAALSRGHAVTLYADHSRPGVEETEPLAELPEAGSGDVSRHCGALKALSERAAEAILPGRVLSVRAGLIVGPRDPTNRFIYWVARMARGGEGPRARAT